MTTTNQQNDQTVFCFLRDAEGYWQQYGVMALSTFRENLKRASGRVVATDPNTGQKLAWSDDRDAPQS